MSESALREEVVRNYKAFMHATEEIRTMEADIQTLKDLLGSTAITLQVHFALYCYCFTASVFTATACAAFFATATAASIQIRASPSPPPAYGLYAYEMFFEASIWLRPFIRVPRKLPLPLPPPY